jgi:hypothetical protein
LFLFKIKLNNFLERFFQPDKESDENNAIFVGDWVEVEQRKYIKNLVISHSPGSGL